MPEGGGYRSARRRSCGKGEFDICDEKWEEYTHPNMNGGCFPSKLRVHAIAVVLKFLHRFAERFTKSRAEFEFINVGPSKENADSR